MFPENIKAEHTLPIFHSYISPYILFGSRSHYPRQAHDCRVFHASDCHYSEARLLSRPPAPDYWHWLDSKGLKPATSSQPPVPASVSRDTEHQNKPSSSNYFRWARNTHIAQNVQCGGTWSTKLIIFSPVVELMILTLHRIFNTPHPKDWGFFHWSCCAWSIVIHQIRARYIKMSCPNSIITSDLDTRF